jgi:Type I phosphodiesterase / nucleotide pyrophosphatase
MPMSLMPRLRFPFESISPCTQCHPGVRVAAVTAKDKLRRILGHGLAGSGAICFSAKYAGSCSVKENGIDDVEAWVGRAQPSQYSGDLSLFVLDAGIKILEEKRADLLYLTLSDYIQHKHAPGQKESDEFLAALDQRLKDLVDLGAVVAVTGDHGMSDKCLPDGKPNVLFLEDQLASRFGKGGARIICPITDPFVRVYLENPADHHLARKNLDCRTLLRHPWTLGRIWWSSRRIHFERHERYNFMIDPKYLKDTGRQRTKRRGGSSWNWRIRSTSFIITVESFALDSL